MATLFFSVPSGESATAFPEDVEQKGACRVLPGGARRVTSWVPRGRERGRKGERERGRERGGGERGGRGRE